MGQPEQPKVKEKAKRPEGMSREAFALLTSGRAHPIPGTYVDLKKKKEMQSLKQRRKHSALGVVTWQYKRFHNSARKDGSLELFHWTKCYKDSVGKIREAEAGEYPWAKWNTKVWEKGTSKSCARLSDSCATVLEALTRNHIFFSCVI